MTRVGIVLEGVHEGGVRETAQDLFSLSLRALLAFLLPAFLPRRNVAGGGRISVD